MFTPIPGEGYASRGVLRKHAYFLKELIRACTVAYTACVCQERNSDAVARSNPCPTAPASCETRGLWGMDLRQPHLAQPRAIADHKHRAVCLWLNSTSSANL